MKPTLKSLEERFYDEFYERFEMDRERNEVSRKMSALGRYVRYVCGVSAAGCGSFLAYKLTKGHASLEQFIFYAGITAASSGLTIHMHEAKKIFESMYRKNAGEMLNEEEITQVKRAGKMGRAAHLGAATAMVLSLGALIPTQPLMLIVLPILPFWYHYTINKGYGALYSSAVDYTIGIKRNF